MMLMAFAACNGAMHFQLDRAAGARAQTGKEQLERIVGGEPAAQSCWATAVEDLKAGCRSMDDDQRSRLAVQFTNCHLDKSGLEMYPCSTEMSVAACTRPMVDSPSGLAYSAYTTFYTHAESMCYYLQSEAFQQATEAAVDRLHSSARGTAEQLGQLQTQATAVAGATENILAEQQQASLAAAELLAGQKAASAELASLQSSQQAAFAAAETSLSSLGAQQHAQLSALQADAEALGAKQQTLIGGLDRVLGLQQALLGDFMDIKSVVFYCCAVLLALGLTSTPRTSSARLPLFAVLSLNAFAEKLVGGYVLRWVLGAPQETVHLAIATMRRLAALGGAACLARSVLRHVDVGRRTLSSLDELKHMQRQASDELADKLAKLEAQAAAFARARILHRQRDAASATAKSVLLQAARRRHSPGRAFSPSYRHASPPSSTGAGSEGGGSGRASHSPKAAKAAASSPPREESPEPPPPPPPLVQLPSAVCLRPESVATEANDAAVPPPPCGAAEEAAAPKSAPKSRPRASRRSSVGSTASDALTPTRRSTRIAQRESIG